MLTRVMTVIQPWFRRRPSCLGGKRIWTASSRQRITIRDIQASQHGWWLQIPDRNKLCTVLVLLVISLRQSL